MCALFTHFWVFFGDISPKKKRKEIEVITSDLFRKVFRKVFTIHMTA